ncbi:MAG: hypothetical protein WC775_03195 [Patescibacteria group bacterium]|jgi:4-amino-4-deoxy-L-arabinose transferase-like glycosyltransferase
MERHNQKIRLTNRIKKYFLEHWSIILFLTFFFVTTAFKLISSVRPFFDWDESLYVQVGREMVQNNFFLAPVWQGKIWFDKPPLSSLFYGIVTLGLPVQPEISARLLVLATTTVIFILLYILYYRVTRKSFIATLTLIATAYSPIFLQRSQVVSLDIFLLLGWVGYLVFIHNPVVSVLFLFLSVQSKSLLGFYPLGIYALFLFFLLFKKEIALPEFRRRIKILIVQGALLTLWYVVMLILYKQKFWHAHIIESHFRRVTASIESHFGQKTFYIDLLREQLGVFIFPSIIGFVLFTVQWFKKKVSDETYFLGMAFVPWFIFLNLTKTKISWYLYPVVPQFFFFAAYPLFVFAKKRILFGAFFLILSASIIYVAFVKSAFFTTYYSGYDPHILISKDAHNKCSSLAVLVSPSTRNTYNTLKKLGLTITTTDWWGDHPSMVFYFQGRLEFFYYTGEFLQAFSKFECASIYDNDVQLLKGKKFTRIGHYSDMSLLKHD